jgi:hypothetical protein
MPSTSALEIGFALAEPADVPVDVDIPADVDVPADEGGAAAFPPAGVTSEACLEPKIADTMLPKMLIVASLRSFLPAPRPPINQITRQTLRLF